MHDIKHAGYELLTRIGWGGMAEIHLARHQDGGQPLVLKRILPSLVDDPANLRMFMIEARLAARFDHPNLVRVHEVGDTYYTMERVVGSDLLAIMRTACTAGGALPIEQAVRIAIGVAAALDYAHELRGADGAPLNIVHRDVTPSNVMVGRDGSVKLLDFGIAKADVDETQVNTELGTVRGKLAYLSPEQCRSLPLDRRSDVFGIGILLYEMTVGQRLFQRPNVFDTIELITNRDVVPPSHLRPHYPPALERIVLRALARDLTKRFETAGAVQRELEEFAADQAFDPRVGLAPYLGELFASPPPPPVEAPAEISLLIDMSDAPPSVVVADEAMAVNEEAIVSDVTHVDTRIPSLGTLAAVAVPVRPPVPPPPAAAAMLLPFRAAPAPFLVAAARPLKTPRWLVGAALLAGLCVFASLGLSWLVLRPLKIVAAAPLL